MQRVRSYCQARPNRSCYGLILLYILTAPISAQMITVAPGDDSLPACRPRQYLLGGWGGVRTSLGEKGITFDFF